MYKLKMSMQEDEVVPKSVRLLQKNHVIEEAPDKEEATIEASNNAYEKSNPMRSWRDTINIRKFRYEK